ncbi:HPP family protein [Gimibacter soli]|uniref:HPP family protein n=1 Tax=Gimibacter soli TaxID=3024400 RepID=A0AAF0BL52_9PROT|nr:HPP family protein [Gimibacter soli]WCL53040.1 HPP family protein [Gimibacter soli]
MARLTFRPLSPVGRLGWLRASLGALLGILITGFVTRWLEGDNSVLPWLIAPMGASSVLLFAVPASPMARPWPVIGGNTISALVALACLPLSDDPAIVAAIAIAAAIGAMSALRCLHPPGGAVAAMVVLGGPAVATLGWSFAFMPVFVNTAILVAAAWAFNNLTGHRYPHAAAPAEPTPGYDLTEEDIEEILRNYDEVLDVGRDDLVRLIRIIEAQAQKPDRFEGGSGI